MALRALKVAALAGIVGFAALAGAPAGEPSSLSRYEYEPDPEALPQTEAMPATPCVGGMAGPYPCNKVDLLYFMPIAAMGCGSTSDIWGWTDPLNGKEYALVGCNNGTAFVDVSVPESPVFLGKLPTHTGNSTWRDLEVYANHAFIVSEASGHGMQVFDLTQLRNVPSPPVTFAETAHYPGVGNTHTIAVNASTGFAYLVGNTNPMVCSGGLDIVDVQNPTSPVFAGCFSARNYVHDTQCVVYQGPDTAHQGKEICFASNSFTSGGSGEDRLTVVDVTNKSAPVEISATSYPPADPGQSFAHQGWLTEDHKYFLMDDELDEINLLHNTHTLIWNMQDLDAPVYMGFFTGPTAAIDHQQFIKGNHAYQSNYRAGLRILDISDVANANLSEVAYFDVYPSSNSASFSGTWANYPFFASGIVVVASIGEGLFVVRPTINPDFGLTTSAGALAACATGSDSTTVSLTSQDGYTGSVTLSAMGLPPGASAGFSVNPVAVPGSSLMTVSTAGTAVGLYPFDVSGTDGTLTHSSPLTLQVTDALPGVPSLTAPANGASGLPPRPTFTWTAATQGVSYDIEIATDAAFATIVASASGLAATTYTPGSDLATNTTHYWRVRAVNGCGAGSTSPARYFTTQAPAAGCPLGSTASLAFGEGFEAGAPGWSTSGTGSTWAASSLRVHSGSFSYRASTSSSVTDQRLVSPAVALPSGQGPLTLQFWNHQTLESRPGGCNDGAIVEVSNDGGVNWLGLEAQLLTDPYDGPVAGGTGNPLAGSNAWCGDPQDWLNAVASLDAYAGQSVRFRFRVGTNNAVSREGWYIDDVAVQSCPVNPTPTMTIDDVAVHEHSEIGAPDALRHANNAIFSVALSNVSGQTATVGYATADGSATAGADYTPVGGTLSFAPGVTTQFIDVPILSDGLREPPETFFVNLTGPANAVLGDAQATGTILESIPGDFDDDHATDILFRHQVSGRNVVWFMDGITRTAGVYTVPDQLPDTNWQIVGSADFDADETTDLLWRHAVSGKNSVWFMDGITRTAGVYTVPSALPDTNWRIVASGHFDGDGAPDLLWRHQVSGRNVVWFMDGITRTAGVFTIPDQLADTNWAIAGAADFDGDSKSDILWRHQVSGKNVAWYMDGITRTAGVYTNPSALPDTRWGIAAVGDYDGDGRGDLLWRHGGSGKIVVWLMSGITRTSGVFTNPDALTDTSWKIVGPK